jgi:hypothetical protein
MANGTPTQSIDPKDVDIGTHAISTGDVDPHDVDVDAGPKDLPAPPPLTEFEGGPPSDEEIQRLLGDISTGPSQGKGTKYEATEEESTPEGHAAAVARREKEHPVGAAVGKAAGESLQDAWDAVIGTPKAVLQSFPPMAAFESIQKTLPIIHAYEQARASGKSVIDSLHVANETAKKQTAAYDGLQKRIDEFRQAPGQATVHSVLDAAMIAATLTTGGELNPATTEVSGAAETRAAAEAAGISTEPAEAPSVVRQIAKGKQAAEPQAQSAMRQAAATTEPSLRESLAKPIEQAANKADELYKEIDDASGTDFKALAKDLRETNMKIRQLTDTPSDQAIEAKLEEHRTGIMDKMESAKQDALAKGVDPKVLKQADAEFKRMSALTDVERKVFKNPSIVQGNVAHGTPETVNIDSAVKAFQKLQDAKPYGGPRLEQAFGRDGANRLLNKLYEAQRQGVHAVKVQTIAKWVGGAAAIETVREAMKLFGPVKVASETP